MASRVRSAALPAPSAERLAADVEALAGMTRPDRPYTRRARSHCPEEWAEPAHLAAGTRVLLELPLRLDAALPS